MSDPAGQRLAAPDAPDSSQPVSRAHPGGEAQVRECMQRWLERAVIGLNLCPFAKAVHVKGQVHYRVSDAGDAPHALRHLREELLALATHAPSVRDTTLLVLPGGFADFLDFNDLLDPAEALVDELGLQGVLQIASFHPRYQFAGTHEEDITNFTNRAPYPTLHLLREDSIARAVQAFPQASTLYEANMRTLQSLGHAGWQRLGVGPTDLP